MTHPGYADLVTPYLTGTRMPPEEREAIEAASDLPESILADLLAGEVQKTMNALHAPPSEDASEAPEQSPKPPGPKTRFCSLVPSWSRRRT